MKPEVWKLKKGSDRRIRSGHPWVFSNEIEKITESSASGSPIVLQDSQGQVVGLGYGNVKSLISFRALSFSSQEQEYFFKTEFLIDQILKSWKLRLQWGFKGSFRMVFGESDFLPGIVIDYYKLKNQSQVLAVQVLTAGMENLIPSLENFFKQLIEEAVTLKLTTYAWDRTTVVIRNDVGIRKLEGLKAEAPRVLYQGFDFDLAQSEILLNSAFDESQTISMCCDLLRGQKTGFFLDQTRNIADVCRFVKSVNFQGSVRVLDLCCYVGHWSTQLTSTLTQMGARVEVTQVDVSDEALAYAKKNAEAAGAVVITQKLDVVHELDRLATGHYDIVIADPPAFIKAKKDIPTGKHAYTKMNSQAFRMVKSGGVVISCSCSGLLDEVEFKDAIRKGAQRAGLQSRNILRGGHSADHPTLMSFSEGVYLKSYGHWVIK